MPHAPRIHLLTGVWDNADLLPGWLAHHREMGFGGVVLMDYGSTDGSLEILRSPEWADFVEILPFSGLDSDVNRELLVHSQSRWPMDWALFIDPDEFVFTPRRSTDDPSILIAMEGHDLVTLPRYEMTAPRSVARSAVFPGIDVMTLRLVEQDQGKVMVRLSVDMPVDLAGHTGQTDRSGTIEGTPTCLLHVPVRSYERFAQKVDHAEETFALNPDLPDWWAWHWRRWIEIRDNGGLAGEYLEQFVNDDDVESLLATGVYARDTRIGEVPF